MAQTKADSSSAKIATDSSPAPTAADSSSLSSSAVPETTSKETTRKSAGERVITVFIILTIIIAGGALVYTAKSLFFAGAAETMTTETVTPTGKGLSFTEYDRALARKLMDQDNDGKCDSCGMPVEMCIDTGQLQCNMDSKSTIGVLSSAHFHADWKIYVNGKAMDLADKAHMERMQAGLPVSSFIHVDAGAPAPETTGDVLHMHATGVPLWIWFESVGMKLDKNCLTMESGEKYCNDGANTLKFYVNGNSNDHYERYVFNDLDKMLISYGPKDEDIQTQQAAITHFAGVH